MAKHSPIQAVPNKTTVAASHLKPFDWTGVLGMRREDVAIFDAAATGFEHIVILRHTNPDALRYVGHKTRFVPKPFDCKIKSADSNVFIAAAGLQSDCSGLVVDPTIVGYKVFSGNSKREKARKEWDKFLTDKTKDELARKVFLRRGAKGFYAVDTEAGSKYFGCLMLSEQNPPTPQFSVNDPAWPSFKRDHLRYLHSDYDLYGLIDIMETEKKIRQAGIGSKYGPVVETGLLQGMTHFQTSSFESFKTFINTGIGVDMIQHAGQDSLEHIDDKLYVFYPNGAKYQVKQSAEAIKDIYSYVFHQQVKR